MATPIDRKIDRMNAHAGHGIHFQRVLTHEEVDSLVKTVRGWQEALNPERILPPGDWATGRS